MVMFFGGIALLLLLHTAFARDIHFPPASGYSQQAVFGKIDDGIDVSTGSSFAGLSTYANLPYVHCLGDENEDVEKYDIGILGAPFDTVSGYTSTAR